MLRCRQEQPVPAALPLLFPPHPALSSFAERREQMPGAPGAVLGTELGVTTLLGGFTLRWDREPAQQPPASSKPGGDNKFIRFYRIKWEFSPATGSRGFGAVGSHRLKLTAEGGNLSQPAKLLLVMALPSFASICGPAVTLLEHKPRVLPFLSHHHKLTALKRP